MKGLILRVDDYSDLDFFDSVKESVDGIILSYLFMLRHGFAVTVPQLRMAISDKLLMLDIEDMEDTEYYEGQIGNLESNFSQFKGYDGIVIANLDLEKVRRESQTVQGRLYYKIDVSNNRSRNRSSDEDRVAFVRESIRCGCKGIVMSAKHLNQIKAIRETFGHSLVILASQTKTSSLGSALAAGGNYEILSSRRWNGRRGIHQLLSFKRL